MPDSCFFHSLRWPSTDVVIRKSVLGTINKRTGACENTKEVLCDNTKVDYISVHETLVVLVCVRQVLQEKLLVG